MHVDYYFATISPYTYLAGTRPAEVAARNGATIAYRPLDIMALFSRTGGVPPGQRHPSRQEWRLQEMRRAAAKLGMPIHLRPAFWPADPARSSHAIIAAAADGTGEVAALVAGLTRACWAEERDVADPQVIGDCLDAAGFDRGIAARDDSASADVYARNLEDAVAAGAFGAPFFVVGQERFWGQDRLGDLDEHLAART